MQRFIIQPRKNWQKTVENQGFIFHSAEGEYWDETACYAFEADEIDRLEAVTEDLHECCLRAVAHVIEQHRLAEFAIPEQYHAAIEKSWVQRAPSLYGRFDLAFTATGEIKMLEYNADTPTSLLEAAVIQWYWLQDFSPKLDQFNSIHEKLIDRFRALLRRGPAQLHLACVTESTEDYMTTSYLMDCATQAGYKTNLLDMEEIGWAENCFWDMDNQPIERAFKLYPWEFMFQEDFGPKTLEASTAWIEPVWKAVLSNKMILKVLWELFPDHPNLLRCQLSPTGMASYVKKPILSREGANILIVENNETTAATAGEYGEEGYIFQEYVALPNFSGNRPVIGSWVVGDQAAGIGIRETKGLIHDNLARFVPHYFA